MKFITVLTFFSIMVFPFVAWGHGEETHIEILPSSVAYQAGEEITVTAMLNTIEAATAFQIQLLYDASSLQLKEVQPNTEDFLFWTKQEGSNGLVELESLRPRPGFQGEGPIATIIFEATQPGASEILLEDSSFVLNAEGEDILTIDEEALPSGGVASSEQSEFQNTILSDTNLTAAIAIGIAIVLGGGIIFFLWQQSKKI